MMAALPEEVSLMPRICIVLLATALFARADLAPAELDAKLAEGRALAAKGEKLRAFEAFEAVIRGSDTQGPKFAARDEILKMGPIPPRPQAAEEQALVARRLLGERHRYYGDVMDRLAGKGQLRGVRLFRKRIWADNGNGAEDGQKQALRDLEMRILNEPSKEDKELHLKIKQSVKKDQWLKAADEQEKRGKKHVARELLKDAYHFGGIAGEAEREKLRLRIETIEAEILDAVSPEEQKAFDDAINHRVWGDLSTRESHHFIFIGDKGYLPRIPGDSILLLDLAYIFLTDMLDNNPDSDGQRITIFFKELWNFGGGIGGGKTIDIGSVDPKAKSISVSNGLYFHELSHCLFDTAMIYRGFIEGVANFGATMALECTGLKAEADVSWRTNLEAFRRDFLARDMKYWRIQNYGPSAGFWLHFTDRYGTPDGVRDWSRWRLFYRLWRAHPLPPDETVEKTRVFGRCLARVYGDAVWKDLEQFGFPALQEDAEKTAREEGEIAEAWREARKLLDGGADDAALEALENLWVKFPDHHLAARARRAALNVLSRKGDERWMQKLRRELGIVMEWKVCGPFHSTSNTALQDVFPPEEGVDYSKEYASSWGKATWFDPKIRFDGLVTFEFPYPDGIACYGVVNVKAPAAVDGWLLIGSDDGWAAWVNGTLVEKVPDDRGYIFDHDRAPIRFEPGWNRLLVKIRNAGGTMGFAARVTDRRGRAIDGIEFANDPFEIPWIQDQKPGKAELVWKDDFNAGTAPSRYLVPCGGWKVVNKVMWGTDDKRNMQWRKFVVTPGKEKDAPAQCIWVKDKTLGDHKDLAIDLKLEMTDVSRPKFEVILDGEGTLDGLSGISLTFHPNGEGCSCRLEHYDHFVYHNPQVVFPAAKTHDLKVVRFRNRMTVTLNGQPVFENISMPAIRTSHFIGIATWNRAVGLDDLAIYRLSEK